MAEAESFLNVTTVWQILFAVSGYVGLWLREKVARREQTAASAHIEDVKAAHLREIETLKAGLVAQLEQQKASAQRELSRLVSELDAEKLRRVFAHSLQFRKEFETYEELWKALLFVSGAAVQMRPIFEFTPKGVSHADHKKVQLDALSTSFATFAELFRQKRPFYSEDVYQACLRLEALALKEHFAGARYNDLSGRDVEKFYKEGEENIEKISILINEVADAIRARIGTVLPSPA